MRLLLFYGGDARKEYFWLYKVWGLVLICEARDRRVGMLVEVMNSLRNHVRADIVQNLQILQQVLTRGNVLVVVWHLLQEFYVLWGET